MIHRHYYHKEVCVPNTSEKEARDLLKPYEELNAKRIANGERPLYYTAPFAFTTHYKCSCGKTSPTKSVRRVPKKILGFSLWEILLILLTGFLLAILW